MSTPRFIDFQLIDVPNLSENIASWEGLVPAIGEEFELRSLLVLYQGDPAEKVFLESILAAAGYTNPDEQAWILAWPKEQALDLAGLSRHLKAQRIMLFGQELSNVGLHLQLAPYVPVEIAGKWYLLADDLARIESEKLAGQTARAGALWKAIKSKFIYSNPA